MRHVQDGVWFSILQHAELLRDVERGVWDVSWGRTRTLETNTATGGRSMELSELVQYHGRVSESAVPRQGE